MKPQLVSKGVRALCPNCNGAITTFERERGGSEIGSIIVDIQHEFEGENFIHIAYCLLKCADCDTAGLAEIHFNNSVASGKLGIFSPYNDEHFNIPDAVPQEIENEFREVASDGVFTDTRKKGAWDNMRVLGFALLIKIFYTKNEEK